MAIARFEVATASQQSGEVDNLDGIQNTSKQQSQFGNRNTATMAQVISQPGHDDMIHDAVLDYYGRRLATCSSDKTIQIFDIDGDQHRLTETLKG